MIVGFIGRMGSGKTLTMTRELHKYYLLGNKILTNYNVSFPHEKIDFNLLFKWAEEQKPLKDVVIALDEIHIILDSRSGMTGTSKIMTFWLNQTRKMNVKLFYTTQYMHQVDKRLRNGTDLYVFCRGIHLTRKDKNYFICFNEITDGDRLKKEIFIGDAYFNLYNTEEVISFLNNEDDGTETQEGT